MPPVSEIRRDCRRIIVGLEGEAVKVKQAGSREGRKHSGIC